MGEFCEIGSILLPNITWLTDGVNAFGQSYVEIHQYVATFLCIVGTLMNLTTVVVLTRPSMISPVNVLLCAVAICDILVMTSYLVFIVHFHLIAPARCQLQDYSYGWGIFTMIHAHVSVICHATSIWLTVSLAQIRVLTIRRATAGPTTQITERFSIILAIVTLIIMAAVNLPNFMTFEIDEIPAEYFMSCLVPEGISIEEAIANSTRMVYTLRAHEKDCMKLKMAFWSNGMIFKVVPCLLLTVSIVALLKIIADVSNKRKNLAQVMKKKVPKDHTTPMLVAVLSIFLIAELPQGVMLVMTGIFSSDTFKKTIYQPLGDFMDFLSLLNSAIGFFIYVGMSRKFRSVFFQLFFSLIHCTPYSTDDEEAEPELSDTLKLLDQQQSEQLLGQRKRRYWADMPWRTRLYHICMACLLGSCCCLSGTRTYKNARRRNQSMSVIHSSVRRKRRKSQRNASPQRRIPAIVVENMQSSTMITQHTAITEELSKNRRASTLFGAINTGAAPGLASALKVAPAALVRVDDDEDYCNKIPIKQRKKSSKKERQKHRSLRLPSQRKNEKRMRKASAVAALLTASPTKNLSPAKIGRAPLRPKGQSIYRTHSRPNMEKNILEMRKLQKELPDSCPDPVEQRDELLEYDEFDDFHDACPNNGPSDGALIVPATSAIISPRTGNYATLSPIGDDRTAISTVPSTRSGSLQHKPARPPAISNNHRLGDSLIPINSIRTAVIYRL
uniref:G_PROTEIN_RECEP_F1_2 domain-containing protein n=1 Tax=Bursaphelenchus xylophilus TaxID=6326 RepID=A0A1I7S5R9_BURXY